MTSSAGDVAANTGDRPTESQLLFTELWRLPLERRWVDASTLLLLYPLVLLDERIRQTEDVLVLVELQHLERLRTVDWSQ